VTGSVYLKYNSVSKVGMESHWALTCIILIRLVICLIRSCCYTVDAYAAYGWKSYELNLT